MDGVISCYSSEIVILLLGADLIAITWSQTGLDKRIALKALCVIGPSATQQIVVWFLLAAIMSMVLPNAVVCAVLCPIAYSMLQYISTGSKSDHAIQAIILAAIAWAAGIGGLGTPLGGAMNLVAVEYLEQQMNGEFMYVDWIIRLFPILLVLMALDIAYLLMIKPKKIALNGTKEYFKQQYSEMPKLSRDELVSAVVFSAATLLAFCRELIAGYLPNLKPAYMFASFGFLMFLIPKENKEPFLKWGDAQKQIDWSLLILFAGGLAAGKLISDSSAAAALANTLAALNLTGGFVTILLFVAFTVIVAEVSSNTAAAAICTPVVISVVQALGLNAVPYIFITAAAFNVAYMLPTSIRAIPVGYGLEPSYLFRNGLVLTVSSIFAVSVIGYAMMEFWPAFSSM